MSGPYGSKKPGLATLAEETELKIVACLHYQEESDEIMTDYDLCGRFRIHSGTLSGIRRKHGLPSRRGGRVI